jgi:hypothetical protein
VLLFPRNAAWDLMGRTLGKADEEFMADRNQTRHAERRKPLDAARVDAARGKRP